MVYQKIDCWCIRKSIVIDLEVAADFFPFKPLPAKEREPPGYSEV
jgi:hypothetical protein